MKKFKNYMKNKKSLKIIGIVLVVFIVFLIFLLLGSDTVSDLNPELTDVLPLEEIAEKDGRDIVDFTPISKEVLPLEEMVKDQNNGTQDDKIITVPEPTGVPPLEE